MAHVERRLAGTPRLRDLARTVCARGEGVVQIAIVADDAADLRAKLAIEDLPIGARLRILVDHEPAVRNVPRSLKAWGQEVVEVAADGASRWRIDVIKRQG